MNVSKSVPFFFIFYECFRVPAVFFITQTCTNHRANRSAIGLNASSYIITFLSVRPFVSTRCNKTFPTHSHFCHYTHPSVTISDNTCLTFRRLFQNINWHLYFVQYYTELYKSCRCSYFYCICHKRKNFISPFLKRGAPLSEMYNFRHRVQNGWNMRLIVWVEC